MLKGVVEYVASFLKNKNLVEPEIKLHVYRNRDSKFQKYLIKCDESLLVFCIDIEDFMNMLKES